jgi:hypothetical protein
MYVFGGSAGDNQLNDLFKFDFSMLFCFTL